MRRFCGGYATSLNFVLLAFVLQQLGYPFYIVLGLLTQWVLSTLVWSPWCSAVLLWMDRIMAVFNILMLGAAHSVYGASLTSMIFLLIFPVVCWFMDFTNSRYGEVTLWYVLWHSSLFAFNVVLAISLRK